MALHSLIFCREPAAVALLQRHLDDISVQAETCFAAADLLKHARQRKFEAILLDMDIDSGRDSIASVRESPYNRSSILFGMTRRPTAMADAFARGATFVLEKPLTADRTARCLRAAQALMLREHRRYYRHGIDMPVMVQLGRGPEARGRGIDLSEGGMMVFLDEDAHVGHMVRVRFPLPDRPLWMEGSATVASVSSSRVGLRFTGLTRKMQLELAHWLNEKLDPLGPARRYSDSPVPGSYR